MAEQEFKSKIFFLPLVLVLLASCACGNAAGRDDENAPDNDASESISALDFEITGEVFEIVWNVFSPNPNQFLKHPSDCAIAKEINRRFNVVLTSSQRLDDNYTSEQRRRIRAGTLPDIFHTHAVTVEDVENGIAREIPRAMIERFAPNYAAMYGELSEGMKINRREVYGGDYLLLGLERAVEMLRTYSVYRLDWLEEIGVAPRGEMIELSDGVVFTKEAFTVDEFVEIMLRFAELGDGDRKGFATGSFYQTGLETIAGTYGLNNSNIEQNGSAVFSFASDAFREFLYFAERLAGLGVANVSDNPHFNRYMGRVGYWNEDVWNLFGEYDYFNNFISTANPNTKLLITPPEIGPNGKQGVGINPVYSDDIVMNSAYMINSKVSDEKLAKILEIFDAVSFDPELYVITTYGFEGEDFEWAGKPYESPVIVNRESSAFTGLFNTGTVDENAGKLLYNFPNEAIYAYTTSAEARRMLIPPYKRGGYDAPDLNSPGTYEYFEKVGWQMFGVKFFNEVFGGRKSAEHDWDAYISELESLGLIEFTEKLNGFPLTDK